MTEQNLQFTQHQNQKQQQRLVMLPQMQQAIQVLQMPIMELAAWMEEQMEINPLMIQEEYDEEVNVSDEEVDEEAEFSDRDLALLEHLDQELHDSSPRDEEDRDSAEERKRHAFAEQFAATFASLSEHLHAQARETFFRREDLCLAEAIIGNLNENGFLQASPSEIAALCKSSIKRVQQVLSKIQTFDPVGVGASTIQECLLLQLKQQGKEYSLAGQILKDHYEDFLHHRLAILQKKLHRPIELIEKVIKEEIACLSLYPGTELGPLHFTQQIVPDVYLREEGHDWYVSVNDDPLPIFRVDPRYLRMLEDASIPQETKEFVLQKLRGIKWLWRTLNHRGETLINITYAIAKHQQEFLMSPQGKLRPLTMQEISSELGLHESTIARTISGKYVETPRGLFSLRSLVGQGYSSDASDEALASTEVRDLIRQLIRNEDKMKPLSDAAIAMKLREQGVSCARRTIAKYRADLQLGNAQQRRHFGKG